MKPRKPACISVYAEECLLALSRERLGRDLALGGAFGLSYFYEYRETHDIDAWWNESAVIQQRERVERCIARALSKFGAVRRRSWGDVLSLELLVGDNAVFGFQIARRDARLEEPVPAPWPQGLLLDSFPDLVASKMVALVERGAPRDFRDIHALCKAGMTRADECWQVWRRRQELAGQETSAVRARLAVLSHLNRIELSRPLESIADGGERKRAQDVREWFRGEFLRALPE